MLKNIGSNWALAILQIVVLIQLTPIQVRVLGDDANGAWLTIASLTSVLSLFILGVPMASVRFIAQEVAKKSTEGVNRAIATCLAMCLALGAFSIVVGAAVSFFFEQAYLRSTAWEILGESRRSEARIAYWLTVGQVGLAFAAQLPFGILDAHHDFVARNLVKVTGLVVRIALIAGVLRYYPSLVLLALVQISCMAVEFTAALILIRRRCPGVRFGLAGADRTEARRILGFSVFALFLNIGAQLAFRSDALVIAAYLPPANGTYFDVGNKFFPPLSEVMLGIGMVVMPTAVKLQATGDITELKRVYLQWTKVALSISILVGVYLLVLGPEFIAWWMGPSFAWKSGRIVQLLMASYVIFLPVRGVAVPILTGLGKPGKPALLLLAMGAVNLVLSLLLVKPYGIFGVALGTAVPNVIFSIAVTVIACREVGVTLKEHLGYVVSRAAIGAVPLFFIMLVLKRNLRLFPLDAPRWKLFIPLFSAGVGVVAMFAIAWIFFVYKNDPYLDLAGKVARLLPGRLKARSGDGTRGEGDQ